LILSEVQFPAAAVTSESAERLFVGGSELADLMKRFDWADTPIGVPEFWPQSLKTAVRIMLTSQQPIWIGWGEALIYLYNDPYKSIIGGKHPWALGRPASAVWREIWGDIAPLLAKAMAGDEGTYVEAQLLIMERNGFPEETYYTFSYSPIPTDDGSPGGIFCANTDDTQRVISERQLSLLRELASSAAESRSVQQACEHSARALLTDPQDLPFAMIYMIEPGSGVARLAALSGIAPDHPAVKPTLPLDATGPWPLAEVLQRHEPRLVDNLPEAFGFDFPSGGWRQRPDKAVVLPIVSSGEAGRSGFVIAGLNPFRLYDKRYADFLDLVGAQVTAAVNNGDAYEEERRRAEALAEIDRAKTAFFSNVSHEFRTPLTLMLSPLEEVLAKPDGQTLSDHRPLLDIAHRNGMRLLKLVNTLLDFSRIEAGRVTASYEPVDLAALTAELASNFRSAIDKAGLRLNIDAPPLPQAVYVDRDMWEKIVLNLLSNAFKFTFEGEIAVAVKVATDGDHAEISVRDTGTGIPAAELPHVFERFRRVDGARGRSFEGSGIGLALVQELVKWHGGDIRVESELDRGSVFTVTIPFGTAHLPADRLNASPAQASTGIRAQAYLDEAMGWLSGGETIDRPHASSSEDLGVDVSAVTARKDRVLLADDNPDMRDYVCRLLGEKYEVEAVADGQAALEAAWRQRPDLVLSDVMMPRLDGFSLLNALRNDSELRDVPIILLSARAGEEAKIEGLEAGADDYLVKPFSARELLARAAANIELSRARSQSARLVQEESQILELLHKVGTSVAAELNLERAVQIVTDAATALTGAAFGSFFYNVLDARGESYMLYTLSGVAREAFAGFPMPRNTAVFAPTFNGEGIIRSDDILADTRYGKSEPHHGMPKGHLPVRSYLSAPVVSRSGEVLGGLFFGHPEPGIFTDRSERILAGIATQAAIAIDNARLFQAAEREVAERRAAEDQLRRLNETLYQSEQALRERESELARVQHIAKVAGIVVDLRDGGFRNGQRSPEYRAIHGLPDHADDTHEGWVARLHPDDRARTERQFLDAVKGTGEQYSSEYRIIRPSDGQVRWIATESRIERTPDGKPLRLIGAHIDITDRAVAKGLLQESEERFRLIANSAPVPMWVSTLVGTRAFANQAYLDFLGASYEEALVFDWRKVLHPEDLPRILQEQIAGEASRKPFVLEARYRRADGEWRWMRSESQPRWDPQGKHIGFIGVAHDVTVAKQAEIELRHLNQSLSVQVARRTRERDRIWNVSEDLLLVLDQRGQWLSTNPAWTAATGWSETELASSGQAGDPNRVLRRACARLTQLLLAGAATRFDVHFPHRDGTSRWISWTATMDEDVIYAVGRDVTAEREAQETLRRTEEALRQSQKLEAMGQLTGGVAHDFNNLLMPIIGSLDMLQRRQVGGEREQRLIGGALHSADRAKTLVQRLLAFARRQPLQSVAVNVTELVTGMAELIESTTGPQIQVVVDVASDVPYANADPNQLEMAILNLSVNARDAMTQGGTLRISASAESVLAGHRSTLKPGSYVRISVADTGTGMEEAVLARAIEPFFSTKGIGKGTGLGLSMVHGLATQLGGALTISSKPGLGTNVELWLPVNDKASTPIPIVPDTGQAGRTTGTALLVDDDDMVRMSTADMLAELGFIVLEASSAEEALRLVERGEHFDVLVTDHLMPGMTGVDLAHAVRARLPGKPVLIISGFAEADGIASDLPRLTKPFRQAELAASVAALRS
jgi:PAS domain S-box-containing protein